MRTSSEALEGNKVRLVIEVDEADVAKAEDETLRRLTHDAQLPGFRPGHVPRRIIAARLGAKGVREEVLRDAIPDYYASAIDEESLDVIAEPEIDITSGEDGGPVVFSAVVEVRPEVTVPGYNGLVITVPNPTATEEEIDSQIDRMRDQFATLSEVSRPAHDGDLVTLNVHGSRDGEPAEGLTADDLVYEVGTGGIATGVDEKLFAAKIGDIFELDAEDAPDGPAHLEILVKQIREKVLPDPDDAFAADASEFETIAELRADLASRLSAVKRLQSSFAIREKTAESLAELVLDDPPEVLVDGRRNDLLQDFLYGLSQRRIPFDDYLAAMGEESDQFLSAMSEQAAKDVKLDLALRAVAKAEDLDPDESEIDEEIVHLAGHSGQSPAETRDALERNARMPLLRAELKKTKAMRWLMDHVAIVDDQGNTVDRELVRAELDRMDGHHHDETDDDADPEES